jgi:ankyrin repeat protein
MLILAPMPFEPLPFYASRVQHEARTEELLGAFRARLPHALELVRRFDPRGRDAKVPWLVRELADDALAELPFARDEARLVVARAQDFADWGALVAFTAAVAEDGEVARFEQAVEGVVGGDLAGLRALLARDPALVRARSTRRTCFDPAVHRATLLHYLAANGVEGARQRTPPNAVALARTLLEAGAEVDALADFYGQPCATMSLLVSSRVPAEAGLQGELVELLLEHGAALEGRGERWGTPLLTALVFDCPQAVTALLRRGAATDDVAVAAGLGRVDDVTRLLPRASAARRHLALALAAQHGQVEALRVLLDAGEDPDRYNPKYAHAHATPLHQAALAGHLAVVELLLTRGARLDREDKIYRATALGWARHAGQREVAERLEQEGLGRGGPAP